MKQLKLASIFILSLLGYSLVSIWAAGSDANDDNPAISSAGRMTDERFEVMNYSFVKKFDPKGKGDYLDIFFDIKNKSDDTVALKLFVMGFYEKDQVPETRKFIDYPEWRRNDCERQSKQIVFFDSAPTIEKKDVFDTVPLKNDVHICKLPNEVLEKEMKEKNY